MIKDLQYYYDLNVFDWDQLEQIRVGLRDDVDVSIFADPKYTWWQMEEIRYGLENMVDVSIFADPKYTWQQMQDIRIRLEMNEDPTEYLTKITIEAL